MSEEENAVLKVINDNLVLISNDIRKIKKEMAVTNALLTKIKDGRR